MELVVQSRGEERRVRIAQRGETYEITVGETTYQVASAPAGADTRSLLIDGVQHEVAVHSRGDGKYWVSTERGSGPAEVLDPLTHLARTSRGGAAAEGRQQVSAYMPGRVVAILVEEGAEVEAGQGVLVLEAMKMENEIQAERAGTLQKLLVEAGQPVEGGDPLFEIG